APAARRRPVPGGGRRPGRVLRPEPVLPPLQAPRRRHAEAVPDTRKNPIKAASLSKKPPGGPPRIQARSGPGRPGTRRSRGRLGSLNPLRSWSCRGLGRPPLFFARRGIDEMETERTLSSAWDQHLASEFTAKSADQALATMAADPHVNLVPL